MILAVGTELTTGWTRDTNSGDLAKELTELGVRVRGPSALPDDLERGHRCVSDAASSEADLVVSTGGLGPTPDDLTREAIAAACGARADGRSRPRSVAARASSSGAASRCPRRTASRPG